MELPWRTGRCSRTRLPTGASVGLTARTETDEIDVPVRGRLIMRLALFVATLLAPCGSIDDDAVVKNNKRRRTAIIIVSVIISLLTIVVAVTLGVSLARTAWRGRWAPRRRRRGAHGPRPPFGPCWGARGGVVLLTPPVETASATPLVDVVRPENILTHLSAFLTIANNGTIASRSVKNQYNQSAEYVISVLTANGVWYVARPRGCAWRRRHPRRRGGSRALRRGADGASRGLGGRQRTRARVLFGPGARDSQ